jgi:alpha/beta superfamily hydrolase
VIRQTQHIQAYVSIGESRATPQARFEIVPGADHFYSGTLDALESVLTNAL